MNKPTFVNESCDASDALVFRPLTRKIYSDTCSEFEFEKNTSAMLTVPANTSCFAPAARG